MSMITARIVIKYEWLYSGLFKECSYLPYRSAMELLSMITARIFIEHEEFFSEEAYVYYSSQENILNKECS